MRSLLFILILLQSSSAKTQFWFGASSTKTSPSYYTGAGISYSFLTSIIPFENTDLIAPARGANTFYSWIQAARIPDDDNNWSLDNEKRYTWETLEPEEGEYDFSEIRHNFLESIEKGQRFTISIMCIEPGSGSASTVDGALLAYPQYLHDYMQSQTVKDWKGEGNWVPNWNDNYFLTRFEALLDALAAWLPTQSHTWLPVTFEQALGRIQIRGYGSWGEWHTAGAGRGSEPPGTKATSETLLRIANAHIDAFPDYPLQCIINAFCCESYPEVAHYLLTATNNWGRIGWANDHLGSTASWYPGYAEENTWTYAGDSLKHLIMNQWKFASINGEPMNSESEVTVSGQVFAEMENQVRLYHVSGFNNQTHFPSSGSSSLNNLRAASKAAGYRLHILGGSALKTATQLKITVNWENAGIAPIYEGWDVVFEIRDDDDVLWSDTSSFNPKLFLPGTTNHVDTYNTTITGSLYIKIIDKRGYREPLPLYNTGRQDDGSYFLTTIS